VSLKVFYTPAAEKELFEAEDHYDLERPGLGAEFLDVVDEALRQLAEHPESSPIARGRVRSKALRRFPYSLLYSVRKDEIRILAVMNQSRRPFYWWGRR
jgi:plasmid stabilization system protein ParE